ncbi:MAG: hypothetical protein WCX23_01120 [Candidatus Paceibacterota bacterium]|jgi:hypothetical protein|nr:hypothetical protein [Candidatus Paceibacterota bacterium]MDD4874842.1 hypothetical protein [Candidatus Paceibacterota bacterium]
MFLKNIDFLDHAVKIKGLSKAKVLAALYNRARPQGMGIFMYRQDKMTEEDALFVIDSRGDDGCFRAKDPFRNEFYFDYLRGRALKVDLSGDYFCSKMYDDMNDMYDNEKSAEKAISELRSRISRPKAKA